MLGIGGIILGIWGVRSVVVQTELPDVTLIDLILAFVILVLLLALSVRAARYFFVQSRLDTRVMGGKGLHRDSGSGDEWIGDNWTADDVCVESKNSIRGEYVD